MVWRKSSNKAAPPSRSARHSRSVRRRAGCGPATVPRPCAPNLQSILRWQAEWNSEPRIYCLRRGKFPNTQHGFARHRSGPHMSGDWMAEIEIIHVPYRGGGPALTDLAAEQVQVTFTAPAVALSEIRAGRGERSASPARNAHRCCREYRQVRRRLSPSSILQSTRRLAIPASERGLPRWVSRHSAHRLSNSPSSLSMKTEKWAEVIKRAGIVATY